jgi:hypothetical protein
MSVQLSRMPSTPIATAASDRGFVLYGMFIPHSWRDEWQGQGRGRVGAAGPA